MTDPKLWLSWETYQKNICNGLGLLQQRGEFVDMTIAADGHHVKVHQMIMSLISPYIKDLITSAQCPHPVIFLNRVSSDTLRSILEYAYTGEVMVTRDKLPEFLEACSVLQIKGLETKMVSRTSDGGLLNFVGARSNPDPAQPTTQETELSLQTEFNNDEIAHDNEQIIEDSPMDENTFSGTDDNIFIETTEEVLEPEEKPKSIPSAMMQYSLSCQGSIQLILNRFIYHMRHTRQSNETVWRCYDYNGKACPANVVTKGDMVLGRGNTHNHPYHDKQILKRIEKGNVYTAFKAVKNIALLNKKSHSAKNKIDKEK